MTVAGMGSRCHDALCIKGAAAAGSGLADDGVTYQDVTGVVG